MRELALCFILAGLAWGAEPAPVKKPRRITGIFRKLAAAEVEGAIRLSGWGIPDPERTEHRSLTVAARQRTDANVSATPADAELARAPAAPAATKPRASASGPTTAAGSLPAPGRT